MSLGREPKTHADVLADLNISEPTTLERAKERRETMAAGIARLDRMIEMLEAHPEVNIAWPEFRDLLLGF